MLRWRLCWHSGWRRADRHLDRTVHHQFLRGCRQLRIREGTRSEPEASDRKVPSHPTLRKQHKRARSLAENGYERAHRRTCACPRTSDFTFLLTSHDYACLLHISVHMLTFRLGKTRIFPQNHTSSFLIELVRKHTQMAASQFGTDFRCQGKGCMGHLLKCISPRRLPVARTGPDKGAAGAVPAALRPPSSARAQPVLRHLLPTESPCHRGFVDDGALNRPLRWGVGGAMASWAQWLSALISSSGFSAPLATRIRRGTRL